MGSPVDRLEAAKAYMRVDGNEDDAVITALLDAAGQYLHNAGITRFTDCASLYDLVLHALTLHWYDHRANVITGTIVGEIPTGLRAAINQLKTFALVEGVIINGSV